MAEHDDLTGLHNRRYFEGRLTEALGHEHAAVVIVDVDHFKFVNDSLGHGPGDDLLREIATTMRSRLRDEDILARFGGDEFAVLLTGPGAGRAREVAGHLEIIPPSSFLPTAEQFGLIRDIDRWVLEHGIPLAAQGNKISINLSARSLGDPGLPDHIAAVIADCGARPESLTFEFTETAAVSSVEDARAFTRALREHGCNAALGDFGTGFGTFLLLKHLPVNALKIDREFVRGLSTSPDDQRIVRSIVQIASEAGMDTVAEGVEDAGALALLREYGVGWAQGFHIERPGPLPD